MHSTQEEVQAPSADVSVPDHITPENKKTRKPRAPRKKKVAEDTSVQAIESPDGKTVIKIKLGSSKKSAKSSPESSGDSPTGITKPKRKQEKLNGWQEHVKASKGSGKSLAQLGEEYRALHGLTKKEKKVKAQSA